MSLKMKLRYTFQHFVSAIFIMMTTFCNYVIIHMKRKCYHHRLWASGSIYVVIFCVSTGWNVSEEQFLNLYLQFSQNLNFSMGNLTWVKSPSADHRKFASWKILKVRLIKYKKLSNQTNRSSLIELLLRMWTLKNEMNVTP